MRPEEIMSSARRHVLLLASAVPAVLFALGCPGAGPEYPKCDKDDHCKKDKAGAAVNEYCLFGECQQCARDSHCATGETCNRGRCEASCASDDQCGAGQICEQSSCEPAQCSETSPCGAGERCDAGRCRAASTQAVTSKPEAPTGGAACDKRKTVLFDFNASDLRPDALEALDAMARCLADNPAWRVTVAGHADERGTTEYNLQLGERRAASVGDYISRRGSVNKARIKTISYGEERPVDTSGTEEGWARNRRGELVVQE